MCVYIEESAGIFCLCLAKATKSRTKDKLIIKEIFKVNYQT